MLFFFFFNDTATTEIYTLSLHDALPIWQREPRRGVHFGHDDLETVGHAHAGCAIVEDPHSDGVGARPLRFARRPVNGARSEEHTSELRHSQISYAVFCLKKKKKTAHIQQ